MDGANVSNRLHERNLSMDYDRLCESIEDALDVAIRFKTYYYAVRTKQDEENRAGFIRNLKSMGWSTDLFQAAKRDDGRWVDKGVDVAIALDGYWLALKGQITDLVLATGDADFASLFLRTRPLKVKGHVAGFENDISKFLAHSADSVILIDKMPGVLKERRGTQ